MVYDPLNERLVVLGVSDQRRRRAAADDVVAFDAVEREWIEPSRRVPPHRRTRHPAALTK
jgi:hypothetical protein